MMVFRPFLLWSAVASLSAAASAQEWLSDNPDAIVDLTTADGLRLLQGKWRYHDAEIVEVDHRSVGPDLRASGPPNRTHDIRPRAGARESDDKSWNVVEPTSLHDRRSTGRLSFGWYRLQVTIPERVAGFETGGSTALLEIVVDDYAEVWVDGKQPQIIGQSGGAMVAGWNVPNRVVLGRNVQPGQRIQIAVFAANGPLSDPPANYIWVRSATIDFYDPKRFSTARPVTLSIDRMDPALDAIVWPGATLEEVAGGFGFTEGPVWVPARVAGAGANPIDQGYLLFSDPNRNTIHRLSAEGQTSVFKPKSGYTGSDIASYKQPGSNGLALDGEGRLTICEHGNRRVTRVERNGLVTVLADRFEGKKLNSPNDLVYRSDGTLYFTDPPFGLPRFHGDPRRELSFSGVYCLKNGGLRLVSNDLEGPNGVALSPDEKYLYVTNWDPARKIVMRYDVGADGSLSQGRVFFDMTSAPGEEALDGIERDALGNLFVSGPGGVWILSPEGRHLGILRTPQLPANFAWGDEDGRTLYMTARSAIYRMRMGPPAASQSDQAQARRIERLDPRLDSLLDSQAPIEVVADGFTWLEGPVWHPDQKGLYFSDVPRNSVFFWTSTHGAKLFLAKSGYSGSEAFTGREPGSNGLAFGRDGRMILCEHGDRRLTRLEADFSKTVLASRFEGKRLNSPNDCVVRPNGDIYFTDPPFGLPNTFVDPSKELGFSGVYRLPSGGPLELLTSELKAPNGIAFSPSGDTLYISNADRENPIWMSFEVSGDGGIGPGRVFASAKNWVPDRPGVPDGMKVDRSGNLFAAGPGGLYIFGADGAHLGTIVTSVATSNCAWGDDGTSLYITAGPRLLRVQTKTSGY